MSTAAVFMLSYFDLWHYIKMLARLCLILWLYHVPATWMQAWPTADKMHHQNNMSISYTWSSFIVTLALQARTAGCWLTLYSILGSLAYGIWSWLFATLPDHNSHAASTHQYSHTSVHHADKQPEFDKACTCHHGQAHGCMCGATDDGIANVAARPSGKGRSDVSINSSSQHKLPIYTSPLGSRKMLCITTHNFQCDLRPGALDKVARAVERCMDNGAAPHVGVMLGAVVRPGCIMINYGMPSAQTCFPSPAPRGADDSDSDAPVQAVRPTTPPPPPPVSAYSKLSSLRNSGTSGLDGLAKQGLRQALLDFGMAAPSGKMAPTTQKISVHTPRSSCARLRAHLLSSGTTLCSGDHQASDTYAALYEEHLRLGLASTRC